MTKLVSRFMRRGMKKMTGRVPVQGSGIEPVEIWARQPKMMSGTGKFQQAVRNGNTVDGRLKNLIELKRAQMIGCEFCVDLGSQIRSPIGFPGHRSVSPVSDGFPGHRSAFASRHAATRSRSMAVAAPPAPAPFAA